MSMNLQDIRARFDLIERVGYQAHYRCAEFAKTYRIEFRLVATKK